MSDFYTEQLVKRKAGSKELMMKLLLVLSIVGAVFLSFIFTFGVLIAIVVIIAAVLLFRKLDVEYEYSYYNGELDIDVIYHKAKRKRIFSMEVSDLEMLAPVDAPEMHGYQQLKAYDYSSGNRDTKLYALVVAKNGQKSKIIFEPRMEIVEGFFLKAPRKVIRK